MTEGYEKLKRYIFEQLNAIIDADEPEDKPYTKEEIVEALRRIVKFIPDEQTMDKDSSLSDWMTDIEIDKLHHFCKDLLKYRYDDDNFFALISIINPYFKSLDDGCKYVYGDDCPMFKAFEKGRRRI